ncbi:MAG TPA: peptidoglycan DD-metalloendopeptidase family protein [Candidatus Baltobacteraceae bacterium]|nr:peptidoglycan DD-metalloendopeptidase family protein [Candidatus Baltobacteraceae bacterium]
MKRVAAAFACAALLAAAPAHAKQNVVATLGDKIQSQQAQIDATRKRLAEKRALLRFQEVRAGDLHRQLEDTNRSIARVGESLDEISAQVHQNRANLAWNQLQLDAARTTLARHTAALERRLVDAYEHGELGYVNVLLSASSFSDFVERWDDIRYLVAANEQTIRGRRAAQQRVLDAERALEGERIALNSSLEREQQARFKLASLADQRVQLVALADAQRRNVAHEVAQLEDLSAAQEAALEQLIRERQQVEAARRAAENAAQRRAAQLAGVELPPPVSDGAPSSFGWPVSGPITSPFGMRNDPLGRGFRMHTGIDIGAPMGSTVTASAGGRIIYSGPEGGYGNTIIIDHGGSTSTLYAHLSQIFVANGQDVQRGQAIGAVGCTGNCTGPHLHFEIRINGVPTDPTARLR